jgi:hypothetical protein
MALGHRNDGRWNSLRVEKGKTCSSHTEECRIGAPFLLEGMSQTEDPLIPGKRTFHIGNGKSDMVESGDPDHPDLKRE